MIGRGERFKIGHEDIAYLGCLTAPLAASRRLLLLLLDELVFRVFMMSVHGHWRVHQMVEEICTSHYCVGRPCRLHPSISSSWQLLLAIALL